MKKTKTVFKQARSGSARQRTIGKEMTISEVMQNHPKTVFVFLDYGLHCVGCPAAGPETIEEAVKVHNIDLKKFLKDLNGAAKK